MPHLIVTPLVHLRDVVASSGSRHVLTLLEDRVVVPPGVEHHLAVDVHDIAEPVEGCRLCGEDHIGLLVQFARGWDRTTPLVVHCWAGISRSTAAALSIAAALDPGRPEEDLAGELRAASPTATPNRRIIMLADDLLGRRGSLVDAVERIGRGQPAERGAPFRLTVPPAT